MSSDTHDRMTRYLLGDGGPDERAELEATIFQDSAAFEEMEIVETELVDAYVRGELTGRRRSQFEEVAARSERMRARISFARHLLAEARGAAAAPSPSAPFARGAWLRAPWSPAGLRWSLAAAALVLVAAAGWWLIGGRAPAAETGREARRAEAPTDQARPAVPTPTPVAGKEEGEAPGAVVSLMLLPGLTRGPDQAGASVSLSPGARTLHLRLEHEGEARRVYAVSIRTPEEREVWSAARLSPVPTGPAVVVDVPASTLAAGEYVVTLTGGDEDGRATVVAEYSFRVRRP
jgi:anti-sigma factor RsiW